MGAASSVASRSTCTSPRRRATPMCLLPPRSRFSNARTRRSSSRPVGPQPGPLQPAACTRQATGKDDWEGEGIVQAIARAVEPWREGRPSANAALGGLLGPDSPSFREGRPDAAILFVHYGRPELEAHWSSRVARSSGRPNGSTWPDGPNLPRLLRTKGMRCAGFAHA